MRPIKKLAARTAAATTTVGLAVTGLGLVTTATAPAASASSLKDTGYGLQATSFATRVNTELVGATSSKTAWTWIACTTLAGKKEQNELVSVNLPNAEDPVLTIDSSKSFARTFKKRKKGIAGGAEGINRVAAIELGPADGPQIVIEGLKAHSKVWADKAGKFHAENEINTGGMLLRNPEALGPLSDPAQQLIDALSGGINQVIGVIRENLAQGNGPIVIPGIGEFTVGKERITRSKHHIAAEGAVLKVLLYGPDSAKGGNDDTRVDIGHSWARMNREIPAGLFHGKAFGISAELLSGIVSVGETGLQPMPCRGTDGKIKKKSLAGLDLANQGQLMLDGITGEAMGKPLRGGAAKAWTKGSIAQLNLGGQLQIEGIVGRAFVKQNKHGRVTKRHINGSSIGALTFNGETYALDPETAAQFPVDQIPLPPEIAKIEFFKTTKVGKRGIRVSAIVLTLAEGTPGMSQLRLGNAQVKISRN